MNPIIAGTYGRQNGYFSFLQHEIALQPLLPALNDIRTVAALWHRVLPFPCMLHPASLMVRVQGASPSCRCGPEDPPQVAFLQRLVL